MTLKNSEEDLRFLSGALSSFYPTRRTGSAIPGGKTPSPPKKRWHLLVGDSKPYVRKYFEYIASFGEEMSVSEDKPKELLQQMQAHDQKQIYTADRKLMPIVTPSGDYPHLSKGDERHLILRLGSCRLGAGERTPATSRTSGNTPLTGQVLG